MKTLERLWIPALRTVRILATDSSYELRFEWIKSWKIQQTEIYNFYVETLFKLCSYGADMSCGRQTSVMVTFINLDLFLSLYIEANIRFSMLLQPPNIIFLCRKREPPWLLDLETSILIRQPKIYSTTSQSWLELEWFVRDLLFIQTLEPWVFASCIRVSSAHFIHSRVTSRLFYKGSPAGAFVLILHELVVWLSICCKGSLVHKLYSFLIE